MITFAAGHTNAVGSGPSSDDDFVQQMCARLDTRPNDVWAQNTPEYIGPACSPDHDASGDTKLARGGASRVFLIDFSIVPTWIRAP